MIHVMNGLDRLIQLEEGECLEPEEQKQTQ